MHAAYGSLVFVNYCDSEFTMYVPDMGSLEWKMVDILLTISTLR